MTVQFILNGEEFVPLNGGPQFTFYPAVSLIVACATQAEVDELWRKLSEDGEGGQCGWLTDRFGLSWQVVPKDCRSCSAQAMPPPGAPRRPCSP